MVKSSITRRIFLSLIAATGIVVISMLLILQWSVDRGFLQYVNRLEQARLLKLAEKLEQAYLQQGNWNFLKESPEVMSRLIAVSMAELGTTKEQQKSKEQGAKAVKDLQQQRFSRTERRLIVLDAHKNQVFGSQSEGTVESFRPLQVKGKTIGYLGLLPSTFLSEIHQLRFVKQQKTAYALVAAVMLLVASLLALILARRLVRPLQELAKATHALALGQYEVRVPVNSDDELGQLSSDFNAMAHGLQNSEQARRQFIADISHELRTPLAVLGGEIEALQDGVRPLNPQAVNSLHVEVVRLNRLVEDLYQLALSDIGALTYRKGELDIVELLVESLQRIEPELERCHLTLSTSLPKDEISIYGDAERLGQLFGNILKNTTAYTDVGGTLTVSAEHLDRCVIIEIMDSAPGVPVGSEGRLFDRLYRLEESRNRASGGAGLGLAICRNIVEAHDGVIEALSSPLGGLLIRITLPLVEPSV
jgi:two-component system sensor histidine kinase BaeS